MIKSYKELIVWQKSIDLAVEVYLLTNFFPQTEIYGLTSQLRRCSVSISSNIAEGRGRGTRKDFRQFLFIALGSVNELQSQLELVRRLPFGKNLSYVSVDNLLIEVLKMLSVMINKLTANS